MSRPTPPSNPLQRRFNFLGIGIISLLAVGFWFIPLQGIFYPQPAMAQMIQERTMKVLTVTGQGKESISTSLAQVTLGVEAQGKTAQIVQQEIARRSSAVVALLRSRNVEKLETTGVNLSPNYTYTNNRQQLVGYMGSNTVNFRIATDKMGDLLDAAVQAGASNINSLSFIATDEAIAAARQRALKAATLDAQAQGKAVLATLNLQPSEIISIVINNAQTEAPQPMAFRGADLAQAKTQVVAGEQQIDAAVTLRMSY